MKLNLKKLLETHHNTISYRIKQKAEQITLTQLNNKLLTTQNKNNKTKEIEETRTDFFSLLK